MKFINLFKKNAVIKNIGWIVVGRIVYMIINFIVGLFSARYLGPSNFGLINYAAAYVTFFSAICTLGINSVIVKELIDKPDKVGEAIGTSIGLRLMSSFLSLLIILGISFMVDTKELITRWVVFYYSISILFQNFEVFRYWFQSKLQSKYSEITTILGYIVVAIYKVFLLISGKSVEWFAVSNTIDYIVVAIILYVIYKKKNGPKLSFSLKRGKNILSKSYHFIISGMMIALYNATDRFMLKQMLTEKEVGYYAIAISISSLCTFLLSAIIQSFTPVIIESRKNNKKLYEKRNRQLYAIIFYISVIASIVICIFSKQIINILYGKEFLQAGFSLMILSWYTAFSYLGVARDLWIVCENKQNYSKYIYICAAILNIIMNYFLIPVWGAAGAAFASLITQIGTIIIFPLFIKSFRQNIKLIIDAILLKI